MNYLRLLVRLRRHPSAVLLATQLLALVLYPFIENTDVGRICFGIFGILVLIATLRIVHRTPFLTGSAPASRFRRSSCSSCR